MTTQPNLVCEMMVQFKMVMSIARADATIRICFVNDAVADRLIELAYMDKG